MFRLVQLVFIARPIVLLDLGCMQVTNFTPTLVGGTAKYCVDQ